jgi:hypothetical protein
MAATYPGTESIWGSEITRGLIMSKILTALLNIALVLVLALTGSCQQTKARDIDPSPLPSSTTPSVIPLPATLDPTASSSSDPAQENLRYGFINHQGEFVIPPKFRGAVPFSGGLAHVVTEKGFAYIDKAGNFVTPPGAYYPNGFSNCGETDSNCKEALHGIRQEVKVLNASATGGEAKQSRFGYINVTGKIVIPLTAHFSAASFSDGMARIGDITQQATPDEIRAAEEEKKRTGYGDLPGLRYGYIDTTGKTVIPPQFYDATPFRWGVAQVSIKSFEPDPSNSGKKKAILRYGYINKQGRYLIEPTLTKSEIGCETGKLLVRNSQARMGKEALTMNSPLVDELCGVSEGLVVKAIGDVAGKGVSYYDRNGKLAIPKVFQDADKFSEGLAAVTPIGSSNEAGYIDKQGNLVIKPQEFSYTGPFKDGMAPVNFSRYPSTTDQDEVLINRSGKLLLPKDEAYQRVEDGISEGLALVRSREDNRCFINDQGEIVIPCKFKVASPFSEGLAAVAIEVKPNQQ